MPGIRIRADALKSICRNMFEKAGSCSGEAQVISNELVEAHIRGYDSHGAGFMPEYIKSAQEGRLVPNQNVKVLSDTGPLLVLDAQRGYGQVMAREAMEMAIARTEEYGMCMVSLRNSHHLGRISSLGDMANEKNFASIHFVNVSGLDPQVAPFMGSDARLGTNPICLSFPSPDDRPPVILDMATSKTAMGKIRQAFQRGEQLPPGLLLDSEGRGTTDPGVMYPGAKRGGTVGVSTSTAKRGAILPFGEHKGFGLSLFVELFGGIATGGPTIAPHHPRPPAIINSMLSIVFDPVKTRLRGSSSIEPVYEELVKLMDYVKGSPVRSDETMSSPQGVVYPGERSAMKSRGHSKVIELDEGTWSSICSCAETLGVARNVLEEHLLKA